MSMHELEIKERNIKRLLVKDPSKVPDEHYPGHTWSLAKLALLGAWAYVYTSILKDWKIRYVDLLAGSGTTIVKETGDIIYGSSLFVKESAFREFDDYILIESNTKKYNALLENAKQLGNISPPKKGDCNKFIKEIFSNLEFHNLVFIDMQGWDLTWENMEAIVKSRSDIIINFPTSSFDRTKALTESQVLNVFFGDSSWFDKALTREDFVNLYMGKLATTFHNLRLKEPYIEKIRVGNTTYFYDMILLCKQGKYVDVWGEYLKSKWDWEKPEQIEHLLDYIKGREMRLDLFSELEEKMSSIKKKSSPLNQPVETKTKTKESLEQWLNKG
jgi:three-Cys-motif partner protein